MKKSSAAILGVAVAGWLLVTPPAPASTRHFWRVASPDHEQTFAYGTEQSRVWVERGRDRHLTVLLDFTNDPFVDRQNPRQYDNFTFAFPDVTLGKDGRTFYYRTAEGRSIPVASKSLGFLGIAEIRLLPNAGLVVEKSHGYLSLRLKIEDSADGPP